MLISSEAEKKLWNISYELRAADTLWGDDPVPWVSVAIDRFKDDLAMTVLDLPCGDGRNVLPIARALPVVIAADSAVNALSIANRKMAANDVHNVVLQQTDMFATRFADNQFDGVFCCDVLGHLVHAREALGELVRICRPGKCIVGNFFALEDTTRGKEMERIGDEEYRYKNQFYFRFRNRAAVAQILSQLPVETISIDLVKWTEPPHEGYREYTHEHASWVFVVRKVRSLC